jgi:alpha-tubulin suppressor-like RCC1 family protein
VINQLRRFMVSIPEMLRCGIARSSLPLVVVSAFACSGDSTSPKPISILSNVSPAQSGEVGTRLTAAIQVKVVDSHGSAVKGATIDWTPAAGSVSASATATNIDGIAQTLWTLGTVAGVQHMSATLSGSSLDAPLQISATALAGPPTSLGIAPLDVAVEPRDSVTFTATPGPDRYGNPTTATATVHWTTTDDVSSPVDAIGRVHGQRAGRSIIRAIIGNDTAEAHVRVPAHWQAIGAGSGHTCALDALGYAFCWGNNYQYDLGVSDLSYDTIPHSVSGTIQFTELAVATTHACGLTADHLAYCWGDNASGELGVGTLSPTEISRPTLVAGGLLFTSVATTNVHTCALVASGDAWCWGWEGEGELGDSVSLSFIGRPSPLKVLGGLIYSSIAGGGSHTCAITLDARGYCWGNDFQGQVGDGHPLAYRTTPVAIAGTHAFASISAGSSHSCAIDTGGVTWCFGSNDSGELGDGSFAERDSPAQISSAVEFAHLFAGDRVTCGLSGTGVAYCWGLNARGQVGDGTTLNKGTPVPVSTTLQFTSISTVSTHTCALTSSGHAYCWGDNSIGQLGDGTFTMRTSPVEVAQP